MKRIAFFCIPAHGHTNPMLPVAAELVKKGNLVRFYSFNEFEEKIIPTGAEFISCSVFLPEITEEEMKKLKNISTTEMTIQDIRITVKMNDFIEKEFESFRPDIIYSDSACFWGKLSAWKYDIPLVVSTSTFAFNQMSSQYMKMSAGELSDLIFGLPKISKELKTLEPYGYKVKSALALVTSDNDTDSIVYTTESFQPCSESFTDHYAFVGPSVFSKVMPDKKKERPLVYISMGTIINERPDFYKKCIEALKDINVDVIISCGKSLDIAKLGKLPDNVSAYSYVNQLDVLSKTDVFITHCGMNSVSESLYMAAPLVLYPQTNEQHAVAKRTAEINAGVMLRDDSTEGIRNAVKEVLGNKKYTEAAMKCCDEFRSAPGTAGAAEFILNAPHKEGGMDILKELNKTNVVFQLVYWIIIVGIICLFGFHIGWSFVWIIGIAAGILSRPIGKSVQKIRYKKLAEIKRSQRKNK